MTTAAQHPQPDSTEQLSHHAYYQLIHTLCEVLPPPLADTPEAGLIRNQAAVARIAAMAPVNADEADIAAHCVAARAQAEDVMRSLRCHTGDIQSYMRLNAQYALMERTAVSIRSNLLRLQTARHNREADEAAASSDEWLRHIACRRMQRALDWAAPPVFSAAKQAVPPQFSDPPPMSPEAVPVVLPATPPMPEAIPAVPRAAPPPLPPRSAPVAASPRRARASSAAEAKEPPRDLAAEADHYALVYPNRARPIRQHGGLPPGHDFGPPDDDLVHAIIVGTSPALRALDGPEVAAA